MKQTAVEWLAEILLNKYHLKIDDYKEFKQAKEMEAKQKVDTSNVTRVEVIQHSPPHNGRAYVNNNAQDVEFSLQDDNRTLKIFLK